MEPVRPACLIAWQLFGADDFSSEWWRVPHREWGPKGDGKRFTAFGRRHHMTLRIRACSCSLPHCPRSIRNIYIKKIGPFATPIYKQPSPLSNPGQFFLHLPPISTGVVIAGGGVVSSRTPRWVGPLWPAPITVGARKHHRAARRLRRRPPHVPGVAAGAGWDEGGEKSLRGVDEKDRQTGTLFIASLVGRWGKSVRN